MAKETKQKLLNRLQSALENLYHNATPHHPQVNKNLWEAYNSWFYGQAESEIEYMQDKLGSSEKEYKRQQKLGFTGNERHYWLVGRITEFGKLYTWGRGGKTLAPRDLINQRGGSSFSIVSISDFEEYSNERLTDTIQIIEAFNTYVENWNKEENLAGMWKDNCSFEIRELKESARYTRKELRKVAEAAREQLLNGTICSIVQAEINKLKNWHKKLVVQIGYYQH